MEQQSEFARIDLTTLEGAKTYLTSVFESARDCFETYGHCVPVALVFATVSPEGEPLPEAGVVIVGADDNNFENDRSKNEYTHALRKLVKSTQAVGIALVQETWIIEGVKDDETIQKYQRGGIQVKDMPGRTEAVLVMLEHFRASGPIMYRATITRDSEGNGTLGEFVALYGSDKGDSSARIEGRFTGFLTHIN